MVVRGKEAGKLLRELGLADDKDSKYHSKKVVVDGITFDSEREARRYGELMALRLAGEIRDLELQKSFELLPVQRDSAGRVVERAVRYKADFYYYDNRRRCYVVEDTKGVRTDDYIIKRKLMLYVHKIKIREV